MSEPIHTFIQPMLAHDYVEKKHNKIDKLIIQPKYDGVRAMFHHNIFQSRSGLTFEGVPEIVSTLSDFAKGFPLYLDGELYSDELDFDTISGIVRRKKNNLSPLREKIYFMIFDLYSIRLNCAERLYLLSDIEKHKHYQVSKSLLIDNTEENRNRYLQLLLDDGYEGIILRDPYALYEQKRSNALLRIKPFDNDVYIIIDVQEEIDINGVPKDTLGAFVCGKKNTKQFSAGGIDDSLKKKVWVNPSYYIGKRVLIKYQRKTASGSLRHPTFVRFVEDDEKTIS